MHEEGWVVEDFLHSGIIAEGRVNVNHVMGTVAG